MMRRSKLSPRAASSRSFAKSNSHWRISKPIPSPPTRRFWRPFMALEILKAGLATTVQDLGRPGYYHLGIPISGAMDRFALRAANLLVGNDEGAAGLECVFMGPELEFTSPATVAVAGAELTPKVNGSPRATWTSFAVEAGDTVSFDFLKSGARAYVAISGGIDVPVVLGSRS